MRNKQIRIEVLSKDNLRLFGTRTKHANLTRTSCRS